MLLRFLAGGLEGGQGVDVHVEGLSVDIDGHSLSAGDAETATKADTAAESTAEIQTGGGDAASGGAGGAQVDDAGGLRAGGGHQLRLGGGGGRANGNQLELGLLLHHGLLLHLLLLLLVPYHGCTGLCKNKN